MQVLVSSDHPAVAPAESLHFRELHQREELHQYFLLRHQVYAAQGYWRADSRQLDIDAYDRHSRFVGCFTKDGTLIGGARFILGEGEPNAALVDELSHGQLPPRPHLYHSQSLFRFDPVLQYARNQGKQFVEFGRTVIHPDWQRAGLGVLLVHAIYGLAHCYGIELGLAAVPPRLTRFYCNLGCRVLQQRGVNQASGIDTELVPLIVDLQRLHGRLRDSLRAGRALMHRGEWLYALHGEQRLSLEAFDWSGDAPGHGWEPPLSRLPLLRSGVGLHDDTLGTAFGSPSAKVPDLKVRREVLGLAAALGIDSIGLGSPWRAPWEEEQVAELAAFARSTSFVLPLSCDVRARASDVESVARIAQSSQQPLEVKIRVGCSPVRQQCEGWDLVRVLEMTQATLRACSREGLAATLLLEDPARTPAHILEPLYHTAFQDGAQALCLADTTGAARPSGVRRLVQHARDFLSGHGYDARLEWSGANDASLSVANSLAAIESGVQSVHATLGGAGERAGNTSLEHLLVHLRRLSGRPYTTEALSAYRDWGATHLFWLDWPEIAGGLNVAAPSPSEARQERKLQEVSR